MLRSTVRRYDACLGRLPVLERRVLVLRAALGRPQARSRERVAAITKTTVVRVTRAERRGLTHLRALGRRGGCAVRVIFGPASTSAVAPPVAPGLSPGLIASVHTPRIAVKGEHTSGVARLPSAGATASASPSKPKPLIAGLPEADAHGAGGGGTSPLVAVIPLLLLGYVAWTVRGERRRRV